jgi:PAS domain S-box-containing protein
VNYEQEQTIMRTGQPLLNIEEHTIWPDGRGDWSLTTKMPLCDEHGAIIGIFGISRDITDLKQTEQEVLQYRDHLEDLVGKRTTELARSNARLHEEIIERRRVEQALRINEQQYRVLAENVMDGLVIVQNKNLVFANKVFATLTGHPPEYLVMTDPASFFRAPDKQIMRAWLENTNNALPELPWHAELVAREGRTIWTEIDQTTIVWDGQPAILLTIHDITDRKLREQRLEEERTRLQQENVSLKSTIKERYRFGDLVGKSAAMQRVYERMISAASSDVNVLVCGESGTGKELIARMLHHVSMRKAQAFVPVNCASIPETLFEREFFGHRKGAFTGADRDTPGLFDRAHQGILFLDEVTELSPGAQAKLLRVLQDGEYTPLGSNTPKQADVLLVAATNKEYQVEIKQGRLRKDFFYRICVVAIDVPPLRERKDDLPLLIEHLLEEYRQKQVQVHGNIPQDLPTDQTMLPGELVQAIYTYDWPGNVRELQNVLQRYLVTCDLNAVLPSLGVSARSRASSTPESLLDNLTLPEAVQALEKRKIIEALTHTGYHVVKTAEMLDIPRSSLYRKIKQYHLQEPD